MFARLHKLVLGANATMGAWTLPELRHLELRAAPNESTWQWVVARCPRIELLVLESWPKTFDRVDAKQLPRLRKVRVRHAGRVLMLNDIAGTALLRQLEGIELGGLPPEDAEVLVERWSDFRHLKTVRLALDVPLQEDSSESDRILRLLRTKTTAEVTVRKYHPY